MQTAERVGAVGLAHLLPAAGTRPLTETEQQAVADILDAAAAWAAGELDWVAAASVGPIARRDQDGRERGSSAYGRFVAMLHTPPDDPRRAALVRLCDDLVRRQGVEVTNRGVFERDELTTVMVKNRSDPNDH